MCGIFGSVDWKDKNKIRLQELINATNLLHHRGPDGGGYFYSPPFFISHRRLSIIDIQGGEQPILSEDGRYCITFNGEIYNFLEIREELKKLGIKFNTNSDTEVLLKGYIHWKDKVCQKLVGMFSFAITDLHEKNIFLARDRAGEKPLFYYHQDDIFYFSSEIKSLSYILSSEKQINDRSLSQYLSLNYVPEEETLLKNIYKVPPGSWMFVKSNKVIKRKYWDLNILLYQKTQEEEAISKLDSLLYESVKISCRSDVPITLALSGGIDSSLVGYYSSKIGSIKDAYCVDFQENGFSEFSQAKIVSDSLGLKLNSVPLTANILEDFLSTVYHADDPLADSSALAVWALAKEVSKTYKVMLGGDGGDELFGGYLTYKATLMYSKAYKFIPEPIRLLISYLSQWIPVSSKKVSFSYKLMRFMRAFHLPPEIANFTWNGTWLPHDVKNILGKNTVDNFLKLGCLTTFSEKDLLTSLQFCDLKNYLPNDILTKVDRMTMAHGLEARAPFLHPNIAEFGLTLPKNFKISQDGQLKYILRQLADIKFGKKISRAKKQGFSIPINQWLRKEARSLLLDCLSDSTLKNIPFINKIFVNKIVQEHLEERKQYGFELWGLMVLVTWYNQKFVNNYYPIIDYNLKEIRLTERGSI